MFKSFPIRLARPEERGYWCGTYNASSEAPRECPGCGRHHWQIGRLLAECAFCNTAVPIAQAASGSTIIVHKNMIRNRRRDQLEAA